MREHRFVLAELFAQKMNASRFRIGQQLGRILKLKSSGDYSYAACSRVVTSSNNIVFYGPRDATLMNRDIDYVA